ncbi:MAG: alanine racemase [Candidatus Eremiobacteraeota bacterium]|nr:alanine racemase [Candidatus Eremiobacteraeota bacterium]
MNKLAWLEIDLDAVAHNFNTVRKRVGEDIEILCVVKADAYGHGACEVSRVLVDSGADRLGVATVDEGKQLRNSGFNVPIQILSATLPGQAREIVEYNLIPTVFTRDMASALSHEAGLKNKKISVHLKVETGMGRIGVLSEDAVALACFIKDLPNLELEGVFTHFATASGPDYDYLNKQWNLFNDVLRELKSVGVNYHFSHVATSAVITDFPDMKLNMVRPGIMLYGMLPAPHMYHKLLLRPVLTLKARVVYVKKLTEDMTLSYDRTYLAPAGSVIATLPIGYADGYSRTLSNRGWVLLKGKQVPVVGRVCMDSILVDVTSIEEVRPGDEAVIIGKQKDRYISVDDIAALMDTINYEVSTLLGKRYPRIFKRGGEIKEIRTLNGKYSPVNAV